MNRYVKPLTTRRALVLLSLLLSVTACKTVSPPPSLQVIYEPVPESLTLATPVPPLRAPVTWGAIALWSDRLRDALDTCNADKATIADLEQHRLMRLTEYAESAR